jgi:hypothetical protein
VICVDRDEIVDVKNARIVMAVFAIVAVMMAAVIIVTAHDTAHVGNMSTACKMHEPRAIVLAISAGSTDGGNVTFSIPSMAKIGKRDVVKVTSFDKPLQGEFNISKSIGKISTANFIPSTSRTDFLNNTSIPVAGVNAVVALEDINATHHCKGNMTDHGKGNMSCHCKGNNTCNCNSNMSCHCNGNMTGHWKGRHSFEFSKLVVELPNGTVQTYKLEKPVKVVYAKHMKKIIIDASANPDFTGLLAKIFGSGQTFPEDAAPVSLTTIPVDT